MQSIPSPSPARLIACPSVTPGTRRGVRRARGGADAARLHGPPLRRRRGARRPGRESGRDRAGRARRISALPAISTWCRRAKAGRATRSAPRSRRPALRARRGRHEERDRRLRRGAARIAPTAGTLSLIITGDEEGPATFGTPRDDGVAGRARDPPGHDPDRRADLGRPARRHGQDRPARLGQHVDRRARARRAMSPIRTAPTIRSRQLARVIAALDALHLDDGNDAFQPSNLEITAVDDGEPGDQRHPRRGDRASSTSASTISSAAPTWSSWSSASPQRDAPGATVDGEDFGRGLPDPAGPALRHRRSPRSRAETGLEPELSTSGGTSDGRFLIALCPVVDFGLPNATMHKLDEARRGGGYPTRCRGSTSGSSEACSA